MNSPDFGNKMKRMSKYWQEMSKKQMSEPDDATPVPLPPQKWSNTDHIIDVQVARWGDRYLAYREALKKAVAKEAIPDSPVHIDFDMIDTCNLACINCSENYRPWSQTKLDLDRLFEDPVFEKGVLPSATIGNGTEPFMVPDAVMKMVRFLRERDVMDIWFHTNGTRFTPEIVEELIDHEVTWIGISMDAFHKETYNRVRGKEFELAMENIHMLIDRKKARKSPFPLIRLTAVSMPENRFELMDFHNYWKQYVDSVEFQTYASVLPIGSTARSHVADHPAFMQVPGMECSQMNWRLSVSASGDVSPCCLSYGFLEEITLGNVFTGDKSLLDIWRSDRMKQFQITHNEPEGFKKYKTCDQCMQQFYVLREWGDIAPVGS
jgi:radical SAM protein with 4Fe4S-binding SPASM domain